MTPDRSESNGIPFTINDAKPLLIVQGLINGKGPFNFAVDTGASMTVIAPRSAITAGVLRTTRAKAISATGRSVVTLGTIASLKIGAVEVTQLDTTIMSLTPLNRALHLRLGGIVGYNFLRLFRVIIDYRIGLLFLQ